MRILFRYGVWIGGGGRLFSREQDMIQTLRLIEGLKVSLLDNLSAVYHAMAKDSTEAVQQALARF